MATIDVPSPPWAIHALACDYDHLAGRVPSLQRAKRVGASTVLWDARIAGHQLLWESRIVSEVPGRRIVWKSVSGIRCDAEIVLSPGAGTGTTVTLSLRYRPRTPIGWLAAWLGLVDRAVRRDLAAFARIVADERAAATSGVQRGPARRRTRHRTDPAARRHRAGRAALPDPPVVPRRSLTRGP